MTVHRFHMPAARPGLMELPEAARLHAARVLRLKEGDALRVFDSGLEFEATIVSMDRRSLQIKVGAALEALSERTVPLRLLMSPLKADLTELVIQKATELGVAHISPTIFDRTDTIARREPTERRIERWHRVAASAAEQSGRAVVPQVDPVKTLKEAMESLGTPREGEMRVVAAEPSLSLSDEAVRSPWIVRSIVLAVGPAGGLSPDDLIRLQAGGFRPERFAEHTLRSETACIAAVAIMGARFPGP